ncbi:MAG TPA: 30S ribosomal protein S19e [Candidatus Nanoarchaeia archaeon]|nr:30S ribosomal protein S19e [Candidatus Nanoarchaeia archaeon]
MTKIYDVEQGELVDAVAQSLKSVPEIKPPEWAPFVKTGHFKERPPLNKDWWYLRSAAVLRKVMLLGPVGVSKLRGKFGGKKNRGHKPEHRYKASGNIIRKILQQLEKAGLIAKTDKGVHKGRILGPKGASLLGKAAESLRPKK